MDFVLYLLQFAVKVVDFVLYLLQFAVKVMDFVLYLLQFAVKVMDFEECGIQEREVAENELKVLLQLSHQHVLAYVQHFVKDGMMTS
jgi:hypothetical protein